MNPLTQSFVVVTVGAEDLPTHLIVCDCVVVLLTCDCHMLHQPHTWLQTQTFLHHICSDPSYL